jgi:MATE family multidrug resistance protein
MVLTGALSSFFTGRGHVRTVMVVDVTSALINVVLDYAWIFGHWGFPEGGIAGAAWATVVGLWFKPLAYAALMASTENRAEYHTLSGWRWEGNLMRRLLRYGSPNSVQMLLEVGSFSLFVLILGRLGARELTASNLAFTINNLAFMPVYGIGIATTSLVGQRLGEDRPDLAARSTWSALVIGGGYNAVMAVIYLAFPLAMLGLAGMNAQEAQQAELQRIVVLLLRFVAAYCLFDTMYVVFSSALKGAGDTRFVLWVTLALAGIPSLGTAFGVRWLGLGLYWGWSVLTVWVLALGVIYLARFLQGTWRHKRVIEMPTAELEGEPAECPEPVAAG